MSATISEISPQAPSLSRRAYRLINRPYYWYRPTQLALRLRAAGGADGADGADGTQRLLRTAWGSHLRCWPDPLGNAIARTGVYDLIVAETLARLADPGETAIDAGANVGVMSNLLAHAVGPRGRVVSFEPHPLIFQTLSGNVSHWRATERIDTVQPRQAAVSSHAGTLELTVEPDVFAHNKGTATLALPDQDRSKPPGQGTSELPGQDRSKPPDQGTSEPSDTTTSVQTVRLADELAGPIGVLKLDVEHHELAALHGAEALLGDGGIRDILFEEHQPPPTPVTTLLERHGYTVLGVRQGTIGPVLSTPAEAYEKQLWDPPALLATLDPERVRRRLQRRGWVCLTSRLRSASALRSHDG